MGFVVENLAFDDPLTFNEQIGDPVADFGGTPVPAPRMALRHAVSLPTYGPNTSGVNSTVAQNLTLRRQLRSLLNNSPYKLAGLYVEWAADPEQNGWYVPDMGQLVDGVAGAGLATGWFNLANVVWRVAGKRRTHRRAAQITMLNQLGGLYARDYLQRFYSSTDFAALTPLALSYLPPSATDITNSGSLAAITGFTLATGSDGTANVGVVGQANLTVASYEQPETAQFNGAVLAYDRLGANTSTTEANWYQVWGPDWPWYWPISETANPDTPVLENGLCRVRYDATNTPGWRIDVWTGAAWTEQCKVTIQRDNLPSSLSFPDNALLSAGLEEYTPERAVMKAVMNVGTANDPSSREMVFITLERGWSGPRFEVYPAPSNSATPLGVQGWIVVTPAATDSDDSAMCIVTSGGSNVSTALGTGHTGLFTSSFAAGNLSDNGFAMLRSATSGSGGLAIDYQISVGVVQAAALPVLSTGSGAYGSTRNELITEGPTTGDYVSADIAFSAVLAQQILECEDMTLASGTSSTSDATASGGAAATATRTSSANHVTQANWPNGYPGVYRVFARCRTSAAQMSISATGSAVGSTVTTASSSYVWLDLGDITISTTSTTLTIKAWVSSGSGTIYVDRLEAYLRQDRTASTAQYQGVQDNALACLYTSYVVGGIVSRA